MRHRVPSRTAALGLLVAAPLAQAETADIEAALAADAAAARDEPAAPSETPVVVSSPRGMGASLLNPDIAFVLDFAVAGFSKPPDERLESGGHDPTVNGFNLQQLELAISGVADPYFAYSSNIIFGIGLLELEEAYAMTRSLPWGLQVKAGQYLTPFGRINQQHLHAWSFVDQTFLVTRVLGDDGDRGLGALVSWLSPLPWYVELVGSAQGAETARSFLDERPREVTSPLDLQLLGRLVQFFEVSDDWSLNLGLTGAFGPNPTSETARTSLYGVDAYLKFRPISRASEQEVRFQTEWLLARRDVPGAVLTSLTGYAQLVWQLAQRWDVGARFELGTPETPGAGVEVDPELLLDPEWMAARERYSLVGSFHPTEFSRLRAQVLLDHPGWQSTPGYAGFLQLELVGGAHGAHGF